MTLEPGYVPHALLHNLKHNRVMHERVVFLTAISRTVPHVDPAYMTEIQDLGDGCYAVKVQLGFQDPFDVTFFLGVLARYHAFELIPAETSFFLSRQAVVIGGKARWRPGVAACLAGCCATPNRRPISSISRRIARSRSGHRLLFRR